MNFEKAESSSFEYFRKLSTERRDVFHIFLILNHSRSKRAGEPPDGKIT